jgi:hypothetical protein
MGAEQAWEKKRTGGSGKQGEPKQERGSNKIGLGEAHRMYVNEKNKGQIRTRM